MVSKLAGDKGMSLLTSMLVSLEFTVASTLTSSICNNSPSKLFPCVLTKAFSIPLVVLICLYQTPTMWLAVRGLLIQVIQSAPWICKESLNSTVTHVLEGFPQFFNCQQSHFRCQTLSVECALLPVNLRNYHKKESVSSELATSIWTGRLQRYVKKTP